MCIERYMHSICVVRPSGQPRARQPPKQGDYKNI